MGWKVRISSVTPAALARVDALAQLLAKLPGITVEQAKHGLNAPPLDLPMVKTEADAQKLAQGLLKMGLICQVQAQAPPQLAPQRPRHSIFDLEEEISKGVPIELRETPISKEKVKKFRPKRSQWIMIAVFLGLIASGFLLRNCDQGSTSTPSKSTNVQGKQLSAVDSARKAKNKARAMRSASQRREERKQHQKALQQMGESDNLLREAARTPDNRKSAEILRKALELNPFNLESWTQLAAKYRRMGDEKRAVECEIAYLRNDKYQKTLEGIAKYFGGKPKAHLTVARVSFTVSDDTLSSVSFHQKSEALYDTVQTLHPEKEFAVENVGKDSLKLRVMPGENFPDFDSWDDLNRKAKLH
jgi:hypothetical protein